MNVPLAPKFVNGRTEAWCSEGCDVRAAGKGSHLYRATVKKRGHHGPANTHGSPAGCRMVCSQLPSPGVSYLHVCLQCFKKTKQVSSPQLYEMKLEAINLYGSKNSGQIDVKCTMNISNTLYFKFHDPQDLTLDFLTIWDRRSCLITQYS